MREHNITDPEVLSLANIAADLRGNYVDDAVMWEGSPFAWIRTRPSSQIGAIAERLVRHWCVLKNLEVASALNTGADLVVAGLRVEVKYSSLWTNTGDYRFQQIRDQNYDYCFCLGISPFDVHAWFIPKAALMEDKPPALVPQHGGQMGRDTKWLSFRAEEPPAWLEPYGGTLSLVHDLIVIASPEG